MEQESFNFTAAVTIWGDFGAQEKKICHCFHFFPSIFHEAMGPDAMILVFWMLGFNIVSYSDVGIILFFQFYERIYVELLQVLP